MEIINNTAANSQTGAMIFLEIW